MHRRFENEKAAVREKPGSTLSPVEPGFKEKIEHEQWKEGE